MTSITLPETFGYVILSCVAAPCVMTSFMGGVSESIERLFKMLLCAFVCTCKLPAAVVVSDHAPPLQNFCFTCFSMQRSLL